MAAAAPRGHAGAGERGSEAIYRHNIIIAMVILLVVVTPTRRRSTRKQTQAMCNNVKV